MYIDSQLARCPVFALACALRCGAVVTRATDADRGAADDQRAGRSG